MFTENIKTLKSLVLLPFNIWLYFVSIPVRLFLFAIGGEFWKWEAESKRTINSSEIPARGTLERRSINSFFEEKSEVKETESTKVEEKPEIKETKVEQPIAKPIVEKKKKESKLPESFSQFKQEGDELIARRRRIVQVETPVKVELKTQETQSSMESEELLALRDQIAQHEQRSNEFEQERGLFETRVADLSKDNSGLKTEMTDLIRKKQELAEKYYDLLDQKAKLQNDIETYETNQKRMQELVNVSQKKCFDFQQEIIVLKNQLDLQMKENHKWEEAINTITSTAVNNLQQESSKKIEVKQVDETPVDTANLSKNQKKKLRKAAKKSEQKEEEHIVAWTAVDHKSNYTELVAEAQKEMLEHKPTFSEIIKENIKKEETEILSNIEKESKPEFTVIGGDLSSKHVIDITSNVASPIVNAI